MTDVDETIPLATLSITPQTPGITAGTGTVNTIPLATLSITPNAPGFQRYPLFEILDSNGNRIDTVTFENLSAGDESSVQVLTLVNNIGSSVDVTLTPTIGDNGTLTETATSTLLSDDGVDYVFTTDTYTVPANSTLPVYIKWRPPSTSRPGLKTWNLTSKPINIPLMEGWDYAGKININGCKDGILTDYSVEVVVDYIDGIMKEDFGDIRFTLTDGTPLSYHLKSYTENETANFMVLIPSIPATPSDLDIYIYSGNPTATTTSTTDIYLFYDDATGTYSDKWVDITSSGTYTTIDGVNAISMTADPTNIRTKTFQVTAPFMVELDMYSTSGVLGLQYCQDATPSSNERYSARINTNSPGYEGILKNTSWLAQSDSFSDAMVWVHCKLTLDSIGNHRWVFGDATALIGTDTQYNTGYLSLNRQAAGTGAVTNIMVSKYTTNPPMIEDILWDKDYDIILIGVVIYTIPDLPELELSNHYIINVGGVNYE